MKINWKRAALALSAPPMCCSAMAAVPLGDYLSISGFGTAGIVHSDYSLADFVATDIQKTGAGYTQPWSAKVDSRLGLQLDADLPHDFSAVLQVISRQTIRGDFKPTVEWANVKYKFSPDLAIRFGRTVLPTFERSDTQNVGYAMPWVRLPYEIAITNPATNADGVDVSYRVHAGDVTHALQLQVGKTSADLAFGKYHVKDLVVLVDTIQSGDTSFHLAAETMKYGLSGVPTDSLKVFSAGGTYDNSEWFVTGDSNIGIDDQFGRFVAGYLSTGVRLHSFTPYVVASKIRQIRTGTSGLAPAANQTTLAAGLRWDFAKDVDVKVQYQNVKNQQLNYLTSFTNLQPAASAGDQANVISVALDFIF